MQENKNKIFKFKVFLVLGAKTRSLKNFFKIFFDFFFENGL